MTYISHEILGIGLAFFSFVSIPAVIMKVWFRSEISLIEAYLIPIVILVTMIVGLTGLFIGLKYAFG